MSLDETEEDYWASSKVKKCNIFDDNVTVEAASDLAKFQKSLAGDADDDNDTIDWDDDPVSSYTSSPKEVALKKQSDIGMKKDAVPGKSSDAVGSMGKLSLSNSSSILGYKVDSEHDLSAVIGSSEPRYDSRNEFLNQEQEIQYLRKKLQQAENAIGTTKLKVDETIKRMINGQPYSLELYRSKDEKLALLDKAIDTHDGNAIICTVIFLKRTLKDQLFNLELLRRPEAVDQYLAYLKAHYNLNEYSYMLEMLNRVEELAILRYKQAVSVDDAGAKISRVKGCLHAHFETTSSLEHDCGLLQQHVFLLQRQRPVDVDDEMVEKEGKHILFRQIPRKASILNMPVITTLYYCCLYHYDEGENLLSSPASIRKEHQIKNEKKVSLLSVQSKLKLKTFPLKFRKKEIDNTDSLTEKQYIWTAVKARAKLKKWSDIEVMFLTKGFFGTKMKCVIGFDKVAAILHKSDATPEILSKYLMLVDDVDKRMELANRMKCHDAIIETYRVQRDKLALKAYFQKLEPNSRAWFLAGGVLKDQVADTNVGSFKSAQWCMCEQHC